ncbi:MAG: zinc-dependent peptidase [Gammaproteobacteria bacterium]|nr:zinc-dependent peptidase [Gammaproteobacteria bacterium]
MRWVDRLRTVYVLRRHPISHSIWEQVIDQGAVFDGLSAVERAHLRELTTLFLHRKRLVGAHDLVVTLEMAVTIAAQACLLILKLGLSDYDGWREVIIYPGAFRVVRNNVDQIGLVSAQRRTLSGESWLRGPVILSWNDVAHDFESAHSAHSVVIHEFAHKLDMRNGRANGMPPLHADMEISQWTEVFSDAFNHLQQRLAHHHRPAVDSYAGTDPAEFFAVVSEVFFTDPLTLMAEYSAVYQQLCQFYRQDPRVRISR